MKHSSATLYGWIIFYVTICICVCPFPIHLSRKSCRCLYRLNPEFFPSRRLHPSECSVRFNPLSMESDDSSINSPTDVSDKKELWRRCFKLLEQLEKPVSSLPGVGPKTQAALNRLGLYTVKSLIFHFPTSFIDRSSLCKDINSVQDGELCTLVATVENIIPAPQYLRAQCRDPSGNIFYIVWFHGDSFRGKNFAVALRKSLGYTPSRRIISGRLKWSENHAKAEIFNPQVVKHTSEIQSVQRIEPVYKLTEGLTQSKIMITIGHAVKIGCALLREIPELFPPDMMSELSWPTLAESLFLAHNPSTDLEVKGRANMAASPARLRIAFQELITQHIFLEITRFRYKNAFYIPDTSKQEKRRIEFQQRFASWEESELIQTAIAALPFSLTISQKRCLGELWRDSVGYTGKMCRMARLLNGDVGSGKTVVAYLTALGCLEHPQLSNVVAFLCPTTLLAQQHVETLRGFITNMENHRQYFDKNDDSIQKIRVELLTAAIVGVKREQILEQVIRCKRNEAVIIVGTHALISDQVTEAFMRISNGKDNRAVPGLALVIIDEEQRLGVEQRDFISRFAAHTMYMSATPIPRTMALIRNSNILSKLSVGGLDISILEGKPDSARNVRTSIVDINNVDDVIEGLMRKIKVGAKVFWIMPVIGVEEDLDTTEGQCMTVLRRFERLRDVFGVDMVGMVHGRMTSSEKNRQLELFADDKSNMSVIVGTTVLEVGIDIPTVSILIVEEADRFGLSQLHQLRGRVGRARSTNQGYGEKNSDCHCVLLTDVFSSHKSGEAARQRLDILRKSSDGKKIAEVDLMIRGPGEKMGQRQAGRLGTGWSIDLNYHLHLELPASILGQFIIRDQSVDQDEYCDNEITSGTESTGTELINELNVLLRLPSNLKRRRSEWANPQTAALLLRLYLCFFGKWDDNEWNTLKALRTLSEMEADHLPMEELVIEFFQMAEKFMTAQMSTRTLLESSSLDQRKMTRQQEEQQIFTAKSLSFKENEVLFLIVDIETTGLNPKTDYIIQLAAKVIGSGSFFSKYIFPPVMLSENIEKMTGITNDFLREGGKDQITGFYHNGRAGAFSDVFDDFCLFCREVSQHHGKPLVMIAHNCVFDLRMINGEIKRKKTIQKNSSETSFPSFSRETGIIAAVDSLTLLRNKQIWKKTAQSLSNRQENVISYPSSYSLEAIYRHLFGTGIQHGHNAVSDVLALERILSSPKLNDWKTLAEKIQLSLVFNSSMVGK